MLNKILEDFEKIIKKLKEVLELERTEIRRDSAIKRFELCFDLAWKSIKVFTKREGVECYSPRACIKEAFQLGLIEHDERWLKMLDDRNSLVHLYKEEKADEVYRKLPEYLGVFKDLLERLKKNK